MRNIVNYWQEYPNVKISGKCVSCLDPNVLKLADDECVASMCEFKIEPKSGRENEDEIYKEIEKQTTCEANYVTEQLSVTIKQLIVTGQQSKYSTKIRFPTKIHRVRPYRLGRKLPAIHIFSIVKR